MEKPDIPIKREIKYVEGKPYVTYCNCPLRAYCATCDTYNYCTFQPPAEIPLWVLGIMALITALAIYFSNLILF